MQRYYANNSNHRSRFTCFFTYRSLWEQKNLLASSLVNLINFLLWAQIQTMLG